MDQPASRFSTPKGRVLGLDLLRILAILLVLGRHMEPVPASVTGPLKWFLDVWHRGGWVGVDLFFVLSGYLVSGLLFVDYKKNKSLNIIRFYIRRGWKIYPPFFTLFAVTMLRFVYLHQGFGRRYALAECCFLQNYFPGLWVHTWSLAVEEHFYLMLPILLTVILRLRRDAQDPFRPILVVVATTAVALLLLKCTMAWWYGSFWYYRNLFPTHLRLDSLFFGVAISYLHHFHEAWFRRVFRPLRGWLILVGLASLLPAFSFPLETTPSIYTMGLTLFYLGSGALLIGVVLSEIPQSRLILLLGTLGAYSYSIYLWHVAVVTWGLADLKRFLVRAADPGQVFFINLLLYILMSFIIGIVMAKVIEIPSLRLRDRWFPSVARRKATGRLEEVAASSVSA